jgi:hypothetical protein
MVERARACYKRKLDEDPSYKCLTRLQVGWAVAGAYPLRTPPRFVQVVNNHAQEILSIARPVRVSLIREDASRFGDMSSSDKTVGAANPRESLDH